MSEKIYEFLTQQDMEAFARKMADSISAPKVIALNGDLGTGKTTFARAFIKHLLGNETIVPSPTFTILQVYKGKDNIINHLDLYRLNDKEELIELDIQGLFSNGITMIEWPQIAKSFLPKDTITLNFYIENEVHKIKSSNTII